MEREARNRDQGKEAITGPEPSLWGWFGGWIKESSSAPVWSVSHAKLFAASIPFNMAAFPASNTPPATTKLAPSPPGLRLRSPH